MTIPSFDDIDKMLNNDVAGNFIFSKLGLEYDFTEAFSELGVELKFPMKMKLSAHLFINKQIAETKFIEVKVIYI